MDKLTKLERFTRNTQAEANRTGESLAIFNLNPYSPLYVMRQWRDAYRDSEDLVAKIDPHPAFAKGGP